MKLIVAGSRTITDYEWVCEAIMLSRFSPINEIVSGGAAGVDLLGEKFARLHGIPVRQFKPDWEGLGKKAGMVRNTEMAKYADALVAIWDGQSTGTANMIIQAVTRRLKVHVVTLHEP